MFELSVSQILDARLMPEFFGQIIPSFDFGESAKCHDLESQIFAGCAAVTDFANHVLADSVGRAKHVAKFIRRENRIRGSGRRFVPQTPLEYFLALGGRISNKFHTLGRAAPIPNCRSYLYFIMKIGQ